MIMKRYKLITCHSIRHSGRILLLCLFIFIIYNLSTFFTDTTTTHLSEVSGIKTLNLGISFESLFAPAENFIPPSLFDSETNHVYCHGSGCRFLFIYHSIEEESETQQFLQMFIQLAKELNRTVVLPNVEKMQIGACMRYTFDYYYSVEELKKMYPDVKFILQEDFKRWTKERYMKPSVRQMIIGEDGKRSRTSVERCLNQFGLNREALESKPIIMEGNRNITNLQDEVTKFLVNASNDVPDAEILLFDYSLQSAMFPQEYRTPIKYSEDIVSKITDMVTRLAPYTAIYWQMERGKPGDMPKCAEKLVLKINSLKSQYGVSNVYLATDYPLKSSWKSFKSHNISDSHHKAIKILNKKIKFESWTSFTIKDRWGKAIKWKKLAESGLPGILDKLMCTQATIFLTAPPECGERVSNYTHAIIQERKELLESDEGEEIINIDSQWKFS